MMNSSFPEAIHLVVGGFAAGTLRAAGAKTLLHCDDWLAWGPCSSDPVLHQKLRTTQWGRADDGCGYSIHELASALKKARDGADRGRAVVVWTANTWSDRLSMCWLFTVLATAGGPGNSPLYLADLRTRYEPTKRNGYGNSIALGHNTTKQLLIGFTRARAISWSTVQAGAKLWGLYSHADPTAFDSARRRGFPSLPMLRSVSNAYGVFFPRLLRGLLRPSSLDAALLGFFRHHSLEDWHTLGSVVIWIGENHSNLIQALRAFLNLVTRRIRNGESTRRSLRV
jgi:hypothetical protein